MTRANTHIKIFFRKHRDVSVCLFLVISLVCIYWQVQNFDFVNFDDDKYVTENRYVQDGLTLESISWSFTATHASNWHPLTWLSHMLDCQLFGLNPRWHHLSNLLFHIVNSLLIFIVFRKMTGNFFQSFVVSTLFALHPLHVESVVWISERKDVLSTFFWLLTLWSYYLYVKHPRIDRYLLVFLFFILGLMSKPMLVTLPFVLFLMDYWPLNRIQTKLADSSDRENQWPIIHRMVLEKIPFLVLAVISSVTTFLVQKHGGAVASLDSISFSIRIANALVSYASYILKAVWPSNMTILYPHPGMILWWKSLGAGLFLISISLFVIRERVQRPYLVVGWCWYIGTLVPVIGVVQAGEQALADRYTYIPLIGLFIIIAWGISELVKRWHHVKVVFMSIATVIVFVFMTITFLQVQYWKNSITLFEHAVKVNSNNYISHNNLGVALLNQGRSEEAMHHYLEALRIKPDYAGAHNNLGVALKQIGRIEEAIRHYFQAVRIKPDYADAYYNLGNALNNIGRSEEAIQQYLQALRVKPDHPETQNNIGSALNNIGRTEEAIQHYLQALRIKPDYVDARNNLGITLFNKGDINGAIVCFKEALRIEPHNEKIRDTLQKVLMLKK